MNRGVPLRPYSWSFVLIAALTALFVFARDLHVGRTGLHATGLLVWAAAILGRRHAIAWQLQAIALTWLLVDLGFAIAIRWGGPHLPATRSFWVAVGAVEVLLLAECLVSAGHAANDSARPSLRRGWPP